MPTTATKTAQGHLIYTLSRDEQTELNRSPSGLSVISIRAQVVSNIQTAVSLDKLSSIRP